MNNNIPDIEQQPLTPRLYKTNEETDQVAEKLSLSSKPIPQNKELSLHLEEKIEMENKDERTQDSLNNSKIFENLKSKAPTQLEEENLSIQIPSIVIIKS